MKNFFKTKSHGSELKVYPTKTPTAKRSVKEQITKGIVYGMTAIAVAIFIILVVFVVLKSTKTFNNEGFFGFIFNSVWKPGSDGKGQYGIGMIVIMTITMLAIAMLFAVPITLFSTLFISEYLSKKSQKIVITVIKLLAGVPSVVFGLFAREQIGALFQLFGAKSNDNLMVAAFTMTFMAIPTMVSLSYNAVQAVPEGYRLASLGLGVSKEKTTFSVVRKSATTKIISAVIMGMSRIVGETMAIMMIAGNATGGFVTDSGLGGFLFSSIRTLAGTIGIEMLENAGSEHESALYAIGLVLFVLVFIINISIMIISNLDVWKQKHKIRVEERNLIKGKTRKLNIKGKKYNSYELVSLVKHGTSDKLGKKMYSSIALLFMWSSTVIIITFTFWIIGVVSIKGLMGLQYSEAFVSINGQDGIFATLFTTIFLVIATLIFAIPLGLAAAVYLSEFSRKNSLPTKTFRFIINLFASTPSIVFGIFGLSVFIIYLKLPFSVLAASLTMTIVVLPMLISNFEDALTSVPDSYKEAGSALGMSKLGILFKITLPNSMEGIITGIILAMAKIIGESAPVYLTLGTAIRMPSEGFLSSGATLTTGIYMLASEAGPGRGESITYLMSLMTIVLVLTLNFASMKISASITGIKRTSIWFRLKEFWTNLCHFNLKQIVKLKWSNSKDGLLIAYKKTKPSTIKHNIAEYIKRKKIIKEIKKEE